MPNSRLQTIGSDVFNSSPIEYIEIPSNIMQLNDGWCCGTLKLREVKIIPKEKQNIIYYDGKSFQKVGELYLGIDVMKP